MKKFLYSAMLVLSTFLLASCGSKQADLDVEIVDEEIAGEEPKDSVITDSKDTTANIDDSVSSSDGNASSGSNISPSAGGNASSGSNSSDSSSNDNSSAQAKPQHTHSWTPHTATKQVWVSNIVTVTDYDTRAAHTCDSICGGCGGRFNSPGECSEHQLAGCAGSRQNVDCIHIQKVVTGTHTEDHGHNETQSYTDYYYCSCGARK